ncbi:MAG: single-stranded DNA-binding protein [Candidatus Azobacteroides sp.]|nr:single-stranded DNA-binding protein [Candidatus Azobacteroides sp.]
MAINKVILVGNVGKDPEVRYFDNGGAVANFTLATSERGYTATNGTVVPERTEWHNIVMWRSLAEIAEKYVRKGSKLYVEGKIRTRSYDDASGNKRYMTEIYADNMELMDKKPDSQQGPVPFPEPSQPAQQANATQQPAATSFNSPAPSPLDNGEKDDLPF